MAMAMQRAQKRLLCPGLGSLSSHEICDRYLDLAGFRGWQRWLEVRNVRDGCGSLRKYATRLEKFDEGVESRVLRDDVEEARRILARQVANEVGDMEIQRVVPSRLEQDILCIFAQRMSSSPADPIRIEDISATTPLKLSMSFCLSAAAPALTSASNCAASCCGLSH